MKTPRLLSAVATAAAVLALAGCGSSDGEESAGAAEGESDAAAAADAFPVTIEHVYGETTIEEKPERIATVAWANHEVPLALGVVPVGMSKATWGDDDDNGVLPWVEDKLTELDAETPVLFDETEGIDFEAVADTAPDVILASYSGLTEEEYDTLSKIAPTIAYPEVAWGTSLQDMIAMNAEAMGLSAEGAELTEELEGTIADVRADHPELEGTSAMFSYLDPKDLSQVGYYTTHDTRPAFLEELGMTTPTVVADASAKTDEFYTTTSAEDTESFGDVDVVITYGSDDTVAALQKDALIGKIPAVSGGSVAVLPDATPLAAAANPSPLSVDWALADYADLLGEAAEQAS